MFSAIVTLHDEIVIAAREEPVLDLVFHQRNVTDGMCELIKGVQYSTFASGRELAVVYPNVKRRPFVV